MSFSSCLVFFAIIVAVCHLTHLPSPISLLSPFTFKCTHVDDQVTYASTAYPSSTTTTTTGSPTSTPTSPPSYYCAPCIRKPTTLPVLSYIQGDNYCKPGQTDQEILVQLYKYDTLLPSLLLPFLVTTPYFIIDHSLLFCSSLISSALGGSSWTNKKNWLSGDYCQWYGVVCDHNKKIVTMYVFPLSLFFFCISLFLYLLLLILSC